MIMRNPNYLKLLVSLSFLTLIWMGDSKAKEGDQDPVDFSSPKAHYCFSKNVFSENFEPIDFEKLSEKKGFKTHEKDLSNVENDLVVDGKIKHPTSDACDGPKAETYDCTKCYKSVSKILYKRYVGFKNSNLIAPSQKSSSSETPKEDKKSDIDEKGKKKLLIVGAGMAGLKSAIDGAMMGYDVTLVESRPDFKRGRNIGMFSPEEKFLASVGMPDSMLTKYVGKFSETDSKEKVTMPFKIEQQFLWQLAQKLGVQTRVKEQVVPSESIFQGQAELEKIETSVGGTRKVQTPTDSTPKETIEFDRIILAGGARDPLRNHVMKVSKVGINDMVKKMLVDDDKELKAKKEDFMEEEGSEQYYFNNFLNSNSSGKGGFDNFVKAMLAGDKVNTEFSVFLSDTNPDIFDRGVPIPNVNPFNLGTTWAALPMNKLVWESDKEGPTPKESRWHIEGNLPDTIMVDGEEVNVKKQIIDPHIRNKEMRDKILIFLAEQIYSLFGGGKINDVPFQDFLQKECGRENIVENGIVIFGIDDIQTTQMDLTGKKVSMAGKFENTDKEYFVVGDAFQEPWYSFGIGKDNAVRGVNAILRALASESIDDPEAQAEMLKYEKFARKRLVQSLIHIYNISQEEKSDSIDKILAELYRNLPKKVISSK